MEMPKPTEADRQRFASFVPDAPGVVTKPMFGNVGAFVNGNMFMGLFGSDIGVKLPGDQQQRLLEQPGAGLFGPKERPMGGYVTLPAQWGAEQAEEFVELALAEASALPVKQPKKRGRAKS